MQRKFTKIKMINSITMKKIITILCCLFCLFQTNAQDQNCNDAIIMNVKGKWTKIGNSVVNPEKTFPPSQYNQLYTRLDKIAAMFQQAYPQPTGIEAKWYRSIGHDALVKNGPVPYQFNSLYLCWYCNQNVHKLMLGSETGTWAYVFVNDLHWFLSEVAGLKIDGATTYLLPAKVGQWEGMTLYDCGSTTYKEHRAVLITRESQLPYTPLTRLQYLQVNKLNLENNLKKQIDIMNKITVRSDAEEEAKKQKGLENIAKNNRPERVEQRKADYLKNYKTHKQQNEETMKGIEKRHADEMKVIEDVWKRFNQNELEQPTIIDPTKSFKEFTTEEKGGRMIVYINNNYFKTQLPRYAPQCMVLYWRSESNNNAPSQFFKKMFEANFPIEKLKLMIDK